MILLVNRYLVVYINVIIYYHYVDKANDVTDIKLISK